MTRNTTIAIGAGAVAVVGIGLMVQRARGRWPFGLTPPPGEGSGVLPRIDMPETGAPGTPTALGLLSIDVAVFEATHTTEAPGPPANDGAVKKYFARTTRGGKKTGWALGWDWCAAGVSWCVAEAGSKLGVAPAMRERIAVWELVEDARAAGTWVPGHELTDEAIAVGNVAVMRRAGGDPSKPGQQGHCGFIVGAKGKLAALTTLDPNAGETWAIQDRTASEIVGVILVRALESSS